MTMEVNTIPKVSVVIPTYNRAGFIGESIQSVLDQTFTDFEMIIVDDGSTDNTREVVGSYRERRIRYLYQENKGVCAACNAGIRVSHGENIAILASDDKWLPNYLEAMVGRLDTRPDVALVCSDCYAFNQETGDISYRVWHKKRSDNRVDPGEAARNALKHLLTRGCFISTQASLIRRRIFEEVGYYDESLMYEDWDMFVRITRRFPIDTVDIPLVMVRKHKYDSLQSNDERMYEGTLKVLQKALESLSFTGEDLKLLRRRLARTHYGYGRDLVVNGRTEAGRQKILKAININPWSFRPYVYLVLSFLGEQQVLTLKKLKKWLGRQVLRR